MQEAAEGNGSCGRRLGLFKRGRSASRLPPRDLAAERERAMLIAHTALWQLRELDAADVESPVLADARRLLAERLTLAPGVENVAPHRTRLGDVATTQP